MTRRKPDIWLVDGPGEFAIDIVGESYYQENLEAICGPRKRDGENLTVDAHLILEDDNPYSKDAVRVEIEGLLVGRLPQSQEKAYRQHLARKRHRNDTVVCRAVIQGGWKRGDDLGHYGVKLDLPRQFVPGRPTPTAAGASVRWGSEDSLAMYGDGLPIAERRAKLDQAIARYSSQGYRVTTRSDTTAQLFRPKKFSFFWALLWFLVFGIGLIVYLLYYAAKKDSVIFLEVDETGRVRRT
jgi:hypothetical protein